jgi:hypothetical protein
MECVNSQFLIPAFRQFKGIQQKNILPFPLINPVHEIPVIWHVEKAFGSYTVIYLFLCTCNLMLPGLHLVHEKNRVAVRYT